MAKLMTMFLVLIAIQACLMLYQSQTQEETLIWTFVTGLNQWGTEGFILALVSIAAGIGLVGVAAATVFGFKTDFLIFAPAVVGFIGLGVVFTNLAKAIQSELIGRVFTTCDLNAALACNPVTFIIAITVGPIALFYVWTVVEWWRGKDY